MMKRFLLTLLTICLLLHPFACRAITDEEKKASFDAAVSELEAWLENPQNPSSTLDSIYSVLDELGGYSCSEGLKYYVMVLQKAENEVFDDEALHDITVMENDRNLSSFISADSVSAIAAPQVLSAYYYGRKAQAEGRISEAVEFFKQSGGFYDSNRRMSQLLPLMPAVGSTAAISEPLFSQNGFLILDAAPLLVSRSVLDGNNDALVLQRLTENPEKYADIAVQSDLSALTAAELRLYQPVIVLSYICDQPLEHDVEMKLSLILNGEELGGSSASVSLRYENGIIYADFGKAIAAASSLQKGEYTLRLTLDSLLAWQGTLRIIN